MRTADRKKLLDETRKMLDSFGCVRSSPDREAQCACEEWTLPTTRYGCPLAIHVYPGDDHRDHPWLACRFAREYSASDWNEGPNADGIYADIPHTNRYSGKYNCHASAEDSWESVVDAFRWHIRFVTVELSTLF